MIRLPQFSVFPYSMPMKAAPFLGYLTAPNVPVLLIPANENRASLVLAGSTNVTLYCSFGAPSVASGMPIGMPITTQLAGFSPLSLLTLLDEVWIWCATGTAQFQGATSGQTLTVSSILGSLAPGMVVSGAGLPANTVIGGNGTGYANGGGAGTYFTNTSSTIAAEAMSATAYPIPIFGYEMTVAYSSADMEPGYDPRGEFDRMLATVVSNG